MAQCWPWGPQIATKNIYNVMKKHEEFLPYDYLYVVNYILGRRNELIER